MNGWLVVSNIFPYIGNVIIPADKLIFFRGVGIPPTRWICSLLFKTNFQNGHVATSPRLAGARLSLGDAVLAAFGLSTAKDPGALRRLANR